MDFIISNLWVDYDNGNETITDNERPVFCWSAVHSGDNQHQTAYEIDVTGNGSVIWKSGTVRSGEQRCIYDGAALTSGEYYTVGLIITDCDGNKSAKCEKSFLYVGKRDFSAKWITGKADNGRLAKYFVKDFSADEKPIKAMIFTCGIGYQYLTVNGKRPDNSYLNPAVSNYARRCYYTVNDVTDIVIKGDNTIGVIVGSGWRNSEYIERRKNGRKIEFFGETKLICEIELEFADGSKKIIGTDESWLAGEGAIRENGVFDGEKYDARLNVNGWNLPGGSRTGFEKAVLSDGEMGMLCPQTIQPVTADGRFKAVIIRKIGGNSYIFDFGKNIAGVCEIKIPSGIKEGTKIEISHAEEILPDGELDKETLRGAFCIDTFIAGAENPEFWSPVFTYHGFRYVKVSGFPFMPDENDVIAVSFYNNVAIGSFFKCGNSLVNSIEEAIVQTERNNLHHIATDCPQRDERQGWMNDATVRFEETPYNFNMGRMFLKIIDDVIDEQNEAGAITCTAPYVFGSQPTDPVCSSFLVIGLEMLLHYGSIETVEKYYEPFKKWNECLKTYRKDGIVEYTLYGDWAGPADFCDQIHDGCRSIVTPGILLSTGYHFLNYNLLAKMALLLGKTDEAEQMNTEAEIVREAFINKWFDKRLGYVANGSEGSQAFALWLGILPTESEALAAKRLYEAVARVGFRLTTGNLTTRYLMDMLAKFGYIDAAWKIMTREEYPSWGYMLANGATTIWERFENKHGSGMNSHDHPMYGAVGYWFYAYICGIKPGDSGWKRFTVKPYMPTDLLYAEAAVDTIYGKIYVKWQKYDDITSVIVDVPFGVTAVVSLPDGEREINSGYHSFFF